MAEAETLITQSEILDLIQQIEMLRIAITNIRVQFTPLQEEMVQAYLEYQAEIKPLVQLYRQLTTKISTSDEISISSTESDREIVDKFTPDKNDQAIKHSEYSQQTEEAVQKDELVEYLVWVIYPGTTQDQQLLSKLQGMNRDIRFGLADMLEELTPSLIRQKTPNEEDNLALCQKRLVTWINALTLRLNELQRLLLNLENSSQFALVQQRRQGKQAWLAYLNRQKQEWQQKIASAAAP